MSNEMKVTLSPEVEALITKSVVAAIKATMGQAQAPAQQAPVADAAVQEQKDLLKEVGLTILSLQKQALVEIKAGNLDKANALRAQAKALESDYSLKGRVMEAASGLLSNVQVAANEVGDRAYAGTTAAQNGLAELGTTAATAVGAIGGALVQTAAITTGAVFGITGQTIGVGGDILKAILVKR